MTLDQAKRQQHAAKAAQLWLSFDQNQRAGVRIGMFPAGPMLAADREGYDGRLLAVALMEQAEKDGGMIA